MLSVTSLISLIASSEVDHHGFDHPSVHIKYYEILTFAASPLSTQSLGVRAGLTGSEIGKCIHNK